MISRANAAKAAKILQSFRGVQKYAAEQAQTLLHEYIMQEGGGKQEAGGFLFWETTTTGGFRPDPDALKASGLGPDQRPDLWKKTAQSRRLYVK